MTEPKTKPPQSAEEAPTNPADEPAFIKEFDAIERETSEVEAEYKSVSRELRGPRPGLSLMCEVRWRCSNSSTSRIGHFPE